MARLRNTSPCSWPLRRRIFAATCRTSVTQQKLSEGVKRHEARPLRRTRPRKARHHRRGRQDPRPVPDRQGHRRRNARLRRPRQDQEGQPQAHEAGARQAAARPLRRQCAQLHRHRPELFRPRRGSRHADPEGADHLQQGADLDLRPERRHHDPEGLAQARLGNRDRHRHRQARALPDQGKHQGRDRRLLRPAASGTRAKAARPSGPSARGWSPRTRSRTRRTSTCGSTSMARSASAATPRR